MSAAFDPAATRIMAYGELHRDYRYSGKWWSFENGEFSLDLKDTEYQTYDAALAEFNRRVQKYLAMPEWRRNLDTESAVIMYLRAPKVLNASDLAYFDIVAIDDEAETLTIKLRKAKQ